MTRFAILSVVATGLLLFPANVVCQEARFGLNGESWVQIEDTDFGDLQELVYLRGVYDGLVFGKSQEIDRFPQDPTWDRLIADLDRFHLESTYRSILVPWALQILHVQATGASDAAIDSAIAFNVCRSAGLGVEMQPDEIGGITRNCAATRWVECGESRGWPYLAVLQQLTPTGVLLLPQNRSIQV